MNWVGPVAALATFLGIWLGHVAVREIEYRSPTLWLPASIALMLGAATSVAALMSDRRIVSAIWGIIGITLLWDALEFLRQHRRVIKGHAPANPANPRHARILDESPAATARDLLDREPVGHPLERAEDFP